MAYIRYRDDMLIIADEDPNPSSPNRNYNKFIEQLINKAKRIYQIEAEGKFYSEVPFLDFTIKVPSDYSTNPRLEFELFVKPSAQKRPLSTQSAHSPSVHRSWPKGQVTRIAKRSSTWLAYCRAKTCFVDTLKHFFIHESIIEDVIEFNPFSFRRPKPRNTRDMKWIILPFHPDLARLGLAKIADEVCSQYKGLIEGLKMQMPGIGFGWSNTLPSLARQMQRIFPV